MNSFTRQFCKLQRSYLKRSSIVTTNLLRRKMKFNEIVLKAASTKLLENVISNDSIVTCNTLYINALCTDDEDGT